MRQCSKRSRSFRDLARDEDGQNIVLGAMLLLLVSAAVMVSFAVGYRVKEKLKLQAMADSGAYSTAVAEARLFNYFAWTNRVHAAHDVAILSIHSHASYVTYILSLYSAGSRALTDISWGMRNWCSACHRSGTCCQSCYSASSFGAAASLLMDGQTWHGGWLRQQWQQMLDEDERLMSANRQHYGAIATLASDQRAMLARLQQAGVPGLLKSMPEDAAKVVDPDIRSGLRAATATAQVLDSVVSWGPSDDWNEIMSASRDNSWVYHRSFVRPSSWDSAMADVRRMVSPCTVVDAPENYGNAKTTAATTALSTLRSNIHSSGDNVAGYGPSKGYGAEDHGGLWMHGVCDCPASWSVLAAEGGIISGPIEEAVGYHFFNTGPRPEPVTHEIGGCEGERGTAERHCGVYIRHPRYRYGSEDLGTKELWGHPHPVVVLTKDNDRMIDKATGKKYPFEFDVDLAIPVPVHFQTLGNEGDRQSGNRMAAIAGALVYYHKPRGAGSDDWQEPPSFWNPYWRAKLHPLKGPNGGIDARGAVLAGDHPKSAVPADADIFY